MSDNLDTETPIRCDCPHCGNSLSIPAKYAGQMGTCKHCQGSIAVPALHPSSGGNFGGKSGQDDIVGVLPKTTLRDRCRRFAIPSICLLVGFLAGYETRTIVLRRSFAAFVQDNAATSPLSPQANAKTLFDKETIQKRGEKVVEFNLGALVSLATIDMTVHSVEESTSLVRRYGNPIVAPSGGKFLSVKMTVRNRLKAPFSFSLDGMLVVDSNAREFHAYSGASVDNCLQYKDLTPAVAESGYVVFLVSVDSSGYALMVRKGGTNEAVRILMPPDPARPPTENASAAAVPPPQPIPLEPPKEEPSDPPIAESTYQQIQKGMTYDQVVSILGRDGAPSQHSQSTYGDSPTTSDYYDWEWKSKGQVLPGKISLHFVNGYVASMSYRDPS